MANVTINDLSAKTSMSATDVLEVDNTSSTDDSEKATFALLGGMEVVTGSDADTAMDVGKLYRVDMSAWATSVRTYTLPTTAAVGERIGIHITAGNATHEIAIRTAAASNDTINGTDYDSADWSKLFITGETVVFECVVANTAWIVLVDGRIPCKAQLDTSTAQSTYTSGSFTQTVLDNQAYDIGDIADPTTNNEMLLRRAGKYFVSWIGSITGIDSGERVIAAIFDGTSEVQRAPVVYSTATDVTVASGWSTILDSADGDIIDLRLFHDEGANGSHGLTDNRPILSIAEILP